jgi:hypothetical protein
MMLRDLAAAWARANCPRVEVQEEFLHRLDRALTESVGCSFVVGRNLTKSGSPFLIHCFCGEFFAFRLTERQAALLHVGDDMFVSASGLNQHNHEPHPEPPVRLEAIHVDNPDALDRSLPIRGTLKYRTEQWWFMPLAIQAACEPAGQNNVVKYHHLGDLASGEGTIPFSLSPIADLRDRTGEPITGVVPLFFQLCVYGDPDNSAPADPFAAIGYPGFAKPHMMHASMPGTPIPAVPRPVAPQKLGTPYRPPSPMASHMLPIAMHAMPSAHSSPHKPWQQPDARCFRAISDIRAVLVEVV